MALVEKLLPIGHRIFRTRLGAPAVPLARRNFVANGRRLARSLAGIGFAALLMMVELGLQSGFVESSLALLRRLDGELMLMSSAKYQFVNPEPFSRRQLYAARGVSGVASVRPFYVQRTSWKNPQDLKLTLVMVFASIRSSRCSSSPRSTRISMRCANPTRSWRTAARARLLAM